MNSAISNHSLKSCLMYPKPSRFLCKSLHLPHNPSPPSLPIQFSSSQTSVPTSLSRNSHASLSLHPHHSYTPLLLQTIQSPLSLPPHVPLSPSPHLLPLSTSHTLTPYRHNSRRSSSCRCNPFHRHSLLSVTYPSRLCRPRRRWYLPVRLW